MNQIKIAITGKMGTGKSTVTRILQELLNEHDNSCYIASYSSVIRKILLELDLNPTRELMQATGDFFREFDKDVWTNALLKEIKSVSSPIVIEGIRYVFERDKLVSNGFKIIKVDSSEVLRKKRIELRDNISIDTKTWLTWQQHSTEKYVDQIKEDFLIINDESLDQVKKSLVAFLNQISFT